ncbi:MAG: hypothetical protein NVSMB65_04870 [Chloroflexota bacterium]
MAVRRASTQYDLWAAGYDRRWRRYTARTHAALLARADLSHATTVVDVGCGTGELERRVLTRWPHLHIIGVEPSAGMRRVTAAKLAPLRAAGGHVTILDGTATALPLPDAGVDAVVLASVLHYLTAPLQALLEARRVLRQGGQLLLVDYVPRCLPITLADAAIRLYDRGHRHTRSPAGLANLLTRAGFSVHSAQTFALYSCMDGAAFLAVAPAQDPARAQSHHANAGRFRLV